MTYNSAKTITGWIIVGGHLGLALLALVTLEPYLDGNQIVNIILVLSPVTLVYFTSIVANWISNPGITPVGPRVNNNFAAIVMLVPAALVGFLAFVILRYPSAIAEDVASLQRWIAASEAVLGTTVGMIVNELFPRRSQPPE